MPPIRSYLCALSALAITTTAASAQNNADFLPDIVSAWVEEQVPDYAPVVQEYGAGCLLPIVMLFPDDAVQAIIDSGGMESGLAEIDAADPEALTPYFDQMQRCIQTVLVGGEMIWPWVVAEYDGDPVVELEIRTSCFMAAIEPLSTTAKSLILEGRDFEDGAGLLIEDEPDMTIGFEDRLEACD